MCSAKRREKIKRSKIKSVKKKYGIGNLTIYILAIVGKSKGFPGILEMSHPMIDRHNERLTVSFIAID
jgi:hypothetical protein